jgi:hypothetical protein
MLNRLKRRLTDAVNHRVDQRIDFLIREHVGGVRHELDRVSDHFRADYGQMRTEFDRIAPQVAALEYRLDSLRRQLSIPEADSDEAQSRAELEHERARLRLELVAHYEERLRRLEVQALREDAPLPGPARE